MHAHGHMFRSVLFPVSRILKWKIFENHKFLCAEGCKSEVKVGKLDCELFTVDLPKVRGFAD